MIPASVLNTFVKTAQIVIWPSIYGFLIALPFFAILVVLWQYFFELKKEQRSIAQAIRLAFPIANLYRSLTFKSDFWGFWLQTLFFGPFLMRYFSELIAVVISTGIVYSFMIGHMGEPAFHFEGKAAVIAIQFSMLLISGEFAGYVSHYLFHRVPWLWSLHRVHHSSESLNIFTTERGHPLDYVISLFIKAPISDLEPFAHAWGVLRDRPHGGEPSPLAQNASSRSLDVPTLVKK